MSRARGPPRRVLDSRERQCRARVHPIEEDPLRPNRKTRCAMGSSPVVNYFSPSAFSRRLVGGKKLVFVSFLSVDSDLGHTSAVHSAGEGPASSGDPSVSAGAASLFGLVTQQGPQQPRCSLPSDCSRTEGLPWFLLKKPSEGHDRPRREIYRAALPWRERISPPFGPKLRAGKRANSREGHRRDLLRGKSPRFGKISRKGAKKKRLGDPNPTRE